MISYANAPPWQLIGLGRGKMTCCKVHSKTALPGARCSLCCTYVFWPDGRWSEGNLDSKVEQAGSVGQQFRVRTDVAATTR